MVTTQSGLIDIPVERIGAYRVGAVDAWDATSNSRVMHFSIVYKEAFQSGFRITVKVDKSLTEVKFSDLWDTYKQVMAELIRPALGVPTSTLPTMVAPSDTLRDLYDWRIENEIGNKIKKDPEPATKPALEPKNAIRLRLPVRYYQLDTSALCDPVPAAELARAIPASMAVADRYCIDKWIVVESLSYEPIEIKSLVDEDGFYPLTLTYGQSVWHPLTGEAAQSLEPGGELEELAKCQAVSVHAARIRVRTIL